MTPGWETTGELTGLYGVFFPCCFGIFEAYSCGRRWNSGDILGFGRGGASGTDLFGSDTVRVGRSPAWGKECLSLIAVCWTHSEV